ncbi:hypothetical protein F4823DRAFT_636713 [Ustulina deusta]|nr:hypothetical protein F4823DRAFT_636713 [Ustulina deusta]
MASITTSHSELINTLRELYMLLVHLGAISADRLRLPDPNTGTHRDSAINVAAALVAGHSPETVKVLAVLPYLDVEDHEMFLQLLPSTFPISYLGANLDEGYFRGRRELLNGAGMAPTAIRLTRSEIYGIEFIYDTAVKLVKAWKPINHPDGVDDYSHVISSYRELHYLASPLDIDFSPAIHANSGTTVWNATQKLRDMYLECGWDNHPVDQSRFRLGQFITRRDTYRTNVVKPLIRAEEEAVE